MNLFQLAVPAAALVAVSVAGGAASLSVASAGTVHGVVSAPRPVFRAASTPDNDIRHYRHACTGSRHGAAQCDAMYLAGIQPNTPSGHGAGDLESAYKLPSLTNGAGQTIALVDAYDNPNAASDLAVYESTYGLPTSVFAKYNQNGQQGNYPSGNTGWGLEEDLDIQMAAAGCPLCNIILVEANSNSWSDLEAAVHTAASLGATVISNSYGGGGASQSSYTLSGVTVLASAGDSGYGVQDPADFPSIVSVGGTVLTASGGSRGWTETVWTGTGSGCATASDVKPSWEKAKWTPGCNNRVMNDVAAVATGVALYDTYGHGGWGTVAGTSISSPLVASVFGLAGNAATQDAGKTFWSKKHHKDLFDVTTGSNGTCTPSYLCHGETGYDGPTGWGTPNGIGAF